VKKNLKEKKIFGEFVGKKVFGWGFRNIRRRQKIVRLSIFRIFRYIATKMG